MNNCAEQFFNQEELIRYSRHFTLPQIGLIGQKKLKSARVLCIGAGGLGSPLLLYLTAAGIGTLGIVDDDLIDLSNLQRQVLYSSNQLNTGKVRSAKARLEALNPHVNIVLHETRLTKDNALEIINQYDIVADGTDNFATRYLVNDACFHLKKPNVYASIFQFEGRCSVFTANDGPCYRCLYDAPPPAGLVPNCAEGGVLGVLPGIMGTLQATEVIKLILGIGSPLIGRLLMFDALAMCFNEFAATKNPQCRLCIHHQSFDSLPNYETETCSYSNQKVNQDIIKNITVQDLQNLRLEGADFQLLDVREPYEYEICNLGGSLIPLSELSNRLNEIDKSKPVIVHCKVGGRSMQAAKLLQNAGFHSVANLTGGILAWAKEIDPSMLQY